MKIISIFLFIPAFFAATGCTKPTFLNSDQGAISQGTHPILLQISAPDQTTAGNCVAFAVSVQDLSTGSTDIPSTLVQLSVADDISSSSPYLDASCTLPAGEVNISSSSNPTTFYFRETSSKSVILKAIAPAEQVTLTKTVLINPQTVSAFAISALSTSGIAGNVQTFKVTAQDLYGNTIKTYSGTIAITSSDNAASLPPSGTLTLGEGLFSVTLKTSGIQSITANDVANNSILGISPGILILPAAPAKLGYLAQPSTGTAGISLSPSFLIAVQDAYGNTATSSNASITVSIANNAGGSGVLSGTTTLTAASGQVFFSNLSIDKVGVGYTLLATSNSLTSVTSTGFNITSAAPSQLVFGTQPSNTAAGTPISPAFTVSIRDSFGNIVTGSSASISMSIANNAGASGILSGTTSIATTSGIATFSTLSINKVGVGYTLAASSGSLTGATSNAFNITPAAAAQLVFTTQPSNTVAGAAIFSAPTVTVKDSFGNTITSSNSSITLAISNNPGSGTLSGTATVTASSGVASFPTLSINKVGTGYTLAATSSSLTGATSGAFNITPAAAAQLAFTNQPSNTVAGVAISSAPTVTVQDSFGNTITSSSASITIAIANNAGVSGVLSGISNLTASSGIISFSTLSINKVGTGYTLSASSSGLTTGTSNPFNITPAAAAQLGFGSQPSNAVAGVSISPALTLNIQDAFGNIVTSSNASVTVAIANNAGGTGVLSGTTTVAAASGIATFSTLSINLSGAGYTLSASATSLTGTTSNAFTITAATASQLAFGTQPSNAVAGASISPALTLKIQDAFGNTVTSSNASVTVAIANNAGGTGVLSGTATVAAASGIATFSTLSINLSGAGYTLSASAPSLTGTTSNAFTISPATASQLTFGTQPSNGTTGLAISPAITVLVQDSFGNTITASSAPITLAIANNAGGSGVLSGTTTVSASSGVSSFSTLTINKVGTGYTLSASSPSLTSVTSSGFNLVPLSGDGSLLTNISVSGFTLSSVNLLDVFSRSSTSTSTAAFSSFWSTLTSSSNVTVTSSSPSRNRTIYLMGDGTTVTLPNASGISGFQVIVKKTTSTCNSSNCATSVTVTSGGGTIDGQTNLTLLNKGSAAWIVSDGTNWRQISRSEPYALEIYSLPGTYTWTVPDGITSIYLSAMGAGASGTCNVNDGSYSGGGGGGYIGGFVTVTPFSAYSIKVGAGGVVTGCMQGINGGNSVFQNTAGTLILTANGGTAPINGSPGTLGAGGSGSQVGIASLTVRSGGAGGTASGGYIEGGAGGSAGGQSGNGNNGGNAGGYFPSGGNGSGGASGGTAAYGNIPVHLYATKGTISSITVDSGGGGAGTQAAGIYGGFPGGGGAGAWNTQPGNGADGVVVIRY